MAKKKFNKLLGRINSLMQKADNDNDRNLKAIRNARREIQVAGDHVDEFFILVEDFHGEQVERLKRLKHQLSTVKANRNLEEIRSLKEDFSKCSSDSERLNSYIGLCAQRGLDKFSLPKLSNNFDEYLETLEGFKKLWNLESHFGRLKGWKSLVGLLESGGVESLDGDECVRMAIQIGKRLSRILLEFHLLYSVSGGELVNVDSWFANLNKFLGQLVVEEKRTSVFREKFLSSLASLSSQMRVKVYTEKVNRVIFADEGGPLTVKILMEILRVVATFCCPKRPELLSSNDFLTKIRNQFEEKLSEIEAAIEDLKVLILPRGDYSNLDVKRLHLELTEEGVENLWINLQI